MNPLSPHIRLRNLYNQYLYMDDKAFYDKVRFYEQNESDIQMMRLEDSLWIQSGYLDALFQVGDYKKYCDKSHSFLERLIYHNISYFQEENAYEETLHKRAAALYHLRKYEDCIDVSQQLLNLNPYRNKTKKVLFFAHRSRYVQWQKTIKAGLMGALLMTAFLLLFHQIVVASFFAKLESWFLNLTLQITIPIFVLLIGAKLLIDVKSRLQVIKWVKCSKLKKAQS